MKRLEISTGGNQCVETVMEGFRPEGISAQGRIGRIDVACLESEIKKVNQSRDERGGEQHQEESGAFLHAVAFICARLPSTWFSISGVTSWLPYHTRSKTFMLSENN